jgi:hypothetical protein
MLDCESASPSPLQQPVPEQGRWTALPLRSQPHHARDKQEPPYIHPSFATKEVVDGRGKLVRVPLHNLLFRIGRDPCLYARRVQSLRENSRRQLSGKGDHSRGEWDGQLQTLMRSSWVTANIYSHHQQTRGRLDSAPAAAGSRIRTREEATMTDDVSLAHVRCGWCGEKSVVGEIWGGGPNGEDIRVGWLHRDGKECVPDALRAMDRRGRAAKTALKPPSAGN